MYTGTVRKIGVIVNIIKYCDSKLHYVEHSSCSWSCRNVFVAGDCVIRKVKRDWKIRNGSISRSVRLLVTPTVVVGSLNSLVCLVRSLRALSILFRIVRTHYTLFRFSFVSITFITLSLTSFSYTTWYLMYFNWNYLRFLSPWLQFHWYRSYRIHSLWNNCVCRHSFII